MKPFVYLVQGEKALVQNYRELSRKSNADTVFLTYDQPLDGAVFYPHSTWAQGRNKLLETALQNDDYLYYIFCDDDIEFKHGSWEEFEDSLLKYMPAVGVPIVPRTLLTRLKFPKVRFQPFFINDEQLIGLHRDVIKDRLVVPYQTEYDQINWWISCEIQQILIQNFYPYAALQFNDIIIGNTCKERYQSSHSDDKSFRKIVAQWLSNQLRQPYKLTAYYNPPRYHEIIFRSGVFLFSHFMGRRNHAVERNRVFRKVRTDSELFERYSRTAS